MENYILRNVHIYRIQGMEEEREGGRAGKERI